MSYIDIAGNILNGKKNVEKDNELMPESFEIYNLLKDVINIIADSKYGSHFILKGGSSQSMPTKVCCGSYTRCIGYGYYFGHFYPAGHKIKVG